MIKVTQTVQRMLILAATLGIAAGATFASTSQAEEAVSLADKAPFSISVKNGAAKVGQQGAVVVTVTAASGFKCNDKYPNKIRKLSVSGDAELAATTVRGSIAGKSIIFNVGVTPKAKGSHAVTGQIRFSICNDSTCHIKKVPLNAKITGK